MQSLRGKSAVFVCPTLLPAGQCICSAAAVAVSGTCSFPIATWTGDLCISRNPPVLQHQIGTSEAWSLMG